jgi:hypothetical protein
MLIVFLTALSLSMIVWGLRRPDRTYQFPILFGAAWLLFVVPQAIGVYSSSDITLSRARADGAINLALFMSVLCAACGFLGYLRGPRTSRVPQNEVSDGRLFAAGCVLLLIAFVAHFKLVSLSGGYLAHYSTHGNYQLEWRGDPVKYVFFVKLVYPGILFCLLPTLRAPNWKRWAVVLVATSIPVANTLLLARRHEAVALVMIAAISVYFTFGWAPPRLATLTAMLLGGLMIVVAPVYRDFAMLGADRSRIHEVDLPEEVASVFRGDRYLEFSFCVVQCGATQRSRQFGYGVGFYNGVISSLVPRQVVGSSVKEGLYLPAPDHFATMKQYYGWLPRYGSNPLGMTDAFREFWFFGAAIYYVIGRLFRVLWDRANCPGNVAFQVLYTLCAPVAMTCVVGNLAGLPASLLLIGMAMVPIAVCTTRPNARSIAGAFPDTAFCVPVGTGAKSAGFLRSPSRP